MSPTSHAARAEDCQEHDAETSTYAQPAPTEPETTEESADA